MTALRTLSVGSALSLTIAAPALAQTPTFAPAATVAASSPIAAARGDLNGDGITDVVSLIGTGASIGVWRGSTSGLVAGATYSLPAATDVEIADLNNDGRADVVTASGPFVCVLLGNGDGTLQPAQSFSANPGSEGTSSIDVAIADFNGDGAQDVISAQPGSLDVVAVLLGRGDGTLGTASHIVFGDTGPRVIAAGDFNGDGISDYAIAHRTIRRVDIRLGNGDGTFRFGSSALPEPVQIQMRAADLDGNGTDDLVIASGLANVNVFLTTNTGALQPRRDYAVRDLPGCSFVECGEPIAVDIRDVNGDGILDLISANRTTHDATVFLGDAENNFTRVAVLASTAYPRAGLLCDVTGDGRLDLVVANGDGRNPDGSTAPGASTLSVYANTTGATTPPATLTWTNLVNATANGTTLRKSGGCAGCFDASATSAEQIAGDGAFEFRVPSASLFFVAGLMPGSGAPTVSTIAFGLRFQNGWAEVREGGSYRSDTRFAAGDTFRIAIASGVVTYAKNGTVFFTSASAPALPLRGAALLADLNAGIDNAAITGGGGGEPPPPPPPPPDGGWSDSANVTTTTSAVEKTGGCAGCYDAFAIGAGVISGTGFFEFRVDDTSKLLTAGLAASYSGTGTATIDFGIRVHGTAAEVREGGLYVAETPVHAGDVLRISVANGVVSYAIDGVVFYESEMPAPASLRAVVALADVGAVVSGILIG